MQFNDIIRQARLLYDDEKYDEASKHYLQALKQAANNKDLALVWAELCWTFYQKGSFSQAIDAAENVLNYDPQYAAREDLYRIKGFSHLLLNESDKAEEFLQKSIEIDRVSDKQKFIIYELGKLHFRQQNYAEAARLFDEVEEWLKDNREDYYLSLLFFKGFIFYYNGKIDKAEAVFSFMLTRCESDTDRANALYGQAYVAFSKKDYLNTINMCEKVTTLNPSFFDMESVAFLTAASFFYLGRYDVFEKYFGQMKKAYPEGRYAAELQRLKANIPKPKPGDDVN